MLYRYVSPGTGDSYRSDKISVCGAPSNRRYRSLDPILGNTGFVSGDNDQNLTIINLSVTIEFWPLLIKGWDCHFSNGQSDHLRLRKGFLNSFLPPLSTHFTLSIFFSLTSLSYYHIFTFLNSTKLFFIDGIKFRKLIWTD